MSLMVFFMAFSLSRLLSQLSQCGGCPNKISVKEICCPNNVIEESRRTWGGQTGKRGRDASNDGIRFVSPRKRPKTTAVTTRKNFSKTFCSFRLFDFIGGNRSCRNGVAIQSDRKSSKSVLSSRFSGHLKDFSLHRRFLRYKLIEIQIGFQG